MVCTHYTVQLEILESLELEIPLSQTSNQGHQMKVTKSLFIFIECLKIKSSSSSSSESGMDEIEVMMAATKTRHRAFVSDMTEFSALNFSSGFSGLGSALPGTTFCY